MTAPGQVFLPQEPVGGVHAAASFMFLHGGALPQQLIVTPHPGGETKAALCRSMQAYPSPYGSPK